MFFRYCPIIFRLVFFGSVTLGVSSHNAFSKENLCDEFLRNVFTQSLETFFGYTSEDEVEILQFSAWIRETIVYENPQLQLSFWETQVNRNIISKDLIAIGLVNVNSREVEILSSSYANAKRASLALSFDPKKKWPIHPFTTDEEIGNSPRIPLPPFLDRPRSGEIPALPTASRSLILEGRVDGRVYSVKMPTNHPSREDYDSTKIDLVDEVEMAPLISNFLYEIESRGVRSRNVILLKDVIAMRDRKSTNGYLLREITSLFDHGTYFVPGFSLAQLSLKHQCRKASKLLGKILGTAYADFVLMTGLQYETPHGQNFLVEVTRDGYFTGRVAFRDLNDTFAAILPIAKFWKIPSRLLELFDIIYPVSNYLSLLPRLASFNGYFVDYDVATESYFQQMDRRLGTNFAQTAIIPSANAMALVEFFESDSGKARLKEVFKGWK